MRRAVAAGSLRPLVALQPHPAWPGAELVALLGALEALYVVSTLRTIESTPTSPTFNGQRMFAAAADPRVVPGGGAQGAGAGRVRRGNARAAAAAARRGRGARDRSVRPRARRSPLDPRGTSSCVVWRRGAARDIGGADPERMTPLRTAEFVRALFAPPSAVSVRVLDEPAELRRRYPLLAAVDRAAASVDRHRGDASAYIAHTTRRNAFICCFEKLICARYVIRGSVRSEFGVFGGSA